MLRKAAMMEDSKMKRVELVGKDEVCGYRIEMGWLLKKVRHYQE